MISPLLFQRGEGAAIFVAATYVYFDSGLSWVLYLVLLFAFDVFILGYLFDAKTGAVIYNIGHSMIAPALLVIPYVAQPTDALLGLICLWFAHIGIDRALGYGLKMQSGFNHTHLGDIGKE